MPGAVFQEDAFQQDIPFGANEAFQYTVTFKFIQQVLGLRIKLPRIHYRPRQVRLVTRGPQELQFKRGTMIQFEATFTDGDGALYDPDNNTVKIQIRKPDATVLTGWNFSDNKYLTKISTGVYRVDYQSSTTDTTGIWTAEVQGVSGSNTSMDDLKFMVKS